MFGFAQFVHILPYILLAITSLAGLTGYTLNYAREKAMAEPMEKKELSFEKIDNQESIADFYSTEVADEYHCNYTIANQFVIHIDSKPPGFGIYYCLSLFTSVNFERPPPCSASC